MISGCTRPASEFQDGALWGDAGAANLGILRRVAPRHVCRSAYTNTTSQRCLRIHPAPIAAQSPTLLVVLARGFLSGSTSSRCRALFGRPITGDCEYATLVRCDVLERYTSGCYAL
ncbi:hypothetical protein VUR80DRAFT_12 [Thermomyces stellatus]